MMFGRRKDDEEQTRCIDCGQKGKHYGRARCDRCHDRSRAEERRMVADRPSPLDRTERLMRELTWETYGVHPDDIFPPFPRGEMACENVMNGLLNLAEEDPFGAMMGKYDDPRYLDIGEEEP